MCVSCLNTRCPPSWIEGTNHTLDRATWVLGCKKKHYCMDFSRNDGELVAVTTVVVTSVAFSACRESARKMDYCRVQDEHLKKRSNKPVYRQYVVATPASWVFLAIDLFIRTPSCYGQQVIIRVPHTTPENITVRLAVPLQGVLPEGRAGRPLPSSARVDLSSHTCVEIDCDTDWYACRRQNICWHVAMALV